MPGSQQVDAFQQFTGSIFSRQYKAAGGAITTGAGALVYARNGGSGDAYEITVSSTGTGNLDAVALDPSRVARTAKETRPVNTAYHPRIHS